MKMDMLPTLAILSVAIATVPSSQYTFTQSVVHNGHPSPLLDFKVTATNEKNETWICNRLQFALSMRFDELVNNGTSVDVHLSNKTVVNEDASNCQVIELFLGGENKEAENQQIIKFDFTEEEGFNDNGDSRYIYLQEVEISHVIAGDRDISANFDFVEQQAKNENNTNTPVEFNPDDSFKCYNGFSMTSKDEFDVEIKSTLTFSQFRMQYSPLPSSEDAINSGKSWKRVFSCDNDISKVLPIIVGVILGLIIVFTIAGYFVAKRRSSHAYEELAQ